MRTQKIIGIVLFVFSLLYLIFSFKYKMGTHKLMGPGFFPVVIGVLLVACTGFHLFRVSRTTQTEAGERGGATEGGSNYWAIFGIVCCTVGYPLVLSSLKFVASTFLVGAAMLFLLRPKGLLFSTLLSAAMAVCCFLIFSRLFGVALPSGPFEDLLFRIGG